MRRLKQEIYFPIIIGIHFLIWAVDLYFYNGNYIEISSNTMLSGVLTNKTGLNIHRILGEIFSSWVVTVFAFNFLMATRAKWVEKMFGGLDKMYLIHRRSGVIAVVLLLAHFIVVPRDLTAFNPGKPLGFYALLFILIGVILSAAPIFKRKIPYHKWFNFHKLMGVFYVLGVIHGGMVNSLIKELPLTRVYVFGMAAVGVTAWIYRAFFYDIFNKKLNYTVETINHIGNNTTEIILKNIDQSLKFRAGQFAFFTFPSVSKREQHPFTISSHPNQKELRLTVKNLGDYTSSLPQKLKEGDQAKVEGPFGHFSSRYHKEMSQIWIAGGIGITPFLSLSKDVYMHQVKLFWCVNKAEEAMYVDELSSIVKNNSKFEFVIWDTSKKGLISIDQMNISDYRNHAYMICGPQAMKSSIIKQLKNKGANKDLIYDEEFAFR